MLKVFLSLPVILAFMGGAASAADRLCDPANEDCRAHLLQLIRDEQVGIDLAV